MPQCFVIFEGFLNTKHFEGLVNDTAGVNIAMLLDSITVCYATKQIFFHFTVQAETSEHCAVQLINPKQFPPHRK